MSFFDIGLDGAKEVFGFIFLNLDVRIARHAEGIDRRDAVTGKQPSREVLDQIFQPEKFRRRAPGSVGIDANESRKASRNLDAGEALFLAIVDDDNQRKCQVRNVRKRDAPDLPPGGVRMGKISSSK